MRPREGGTILPQAKDGAKEKEGEVDVVVGADGSNFSHAYGTARGRAQQNMVRFWRIGEGRFQTAHEGCACGDGVEHNPDGRRGFDAEIFYASVEWGVGVILLFRQCKTADAHKIVTALMRGGEGGG